VSKLNDGPHDGDEFADDLSHEVIDEERRDLAGLGRQLAESRPVPRATFRSAVRSELLADSAGTAARSRIAALVLGYAGSGALLLVVAAAGLVGVGPFAV
jgi:hypothetical protein